MTYLGSTPQTQSFISGTDYFNGDGSTVAFTLSRSVGSVNDIEVLVNNVEQQPNTVYTVLGTTLTFTTAPSSGTQNIYVRYLSTTTQAITPSQGSVGSSQLQTNLTLAGTTTASTITSAAATALTLQSAGTTAVTVDASGNVGVGQLNPSAYAKFVVTGSASANSIVTETAAFLSGGSNGLLVGTDGTDVLLGVGNSGTKLSLTSRAGGVFSKALTIDSSGNLLVGTTAAFNSCKQALVFNGATNIGFAIKNSDATVGQTFVGFYNSAGTNIGGISQNATTTVNYATSSDYRLKENVTPMMGALDIIAQLKPITYTWIEGGEADNGFLAHELQTVLPNAVTGEKDAVNEDGSIKIQGVDYSKIVATLTAAIQEQQALITDLTTRLSALEAK